MTAIAPWRHVLGRSLHLNRALAYARYFQLATVRANGRPANRTVVFRGFLPESNAIAIITDQRSQKIAQIEQQHGWAEICWYFPKTREQFRFAGVIHIVDALHPKDNWHKAYHNTWQTLSPAAQAQFYDVALSQFTDVERIELETQDDSDKIPESFRLLIFEPEDLDYLNLKTHPHHHCRYWIEQDGSWQSEGLIP
jgi:pyridoxamine 5'-phosphate oxidase